MKVVEKIRQYIKPIIFLTLASLVFFSFLFIGVEQFRIIPNKTYKEPNINEHLVTFSAGWSGIEGNIRKVTTGTSGTMNIKFDFDGTSNGETFVDGEIRITNATKPVVVDYTKIGIGTGNGNDVKDVYLDGDDIVVILSDITNVYLNLLPTISHSSTSFLQNADFLTGESQVILTGRVISDSDEVGQEVRVSYDLHYEFTGTVSADIAMDTTVKYNGTDKIIVIYTIEPGVSSTVTSTVGTLGIADSNFDFYIPDFLGVEPNVKSVTISNKKATAPADMPITTLSDDDRHLNVIYTASSGTSIYAYQSTTASNRRLYTVKVMVEYDITDSGLTPEVVEQHANEPFIATATLTNYPFHPYDNTVTPTTTTVSNSDTIGTVIGNLATIIGSASTSTGYNPTRQDLRDDVTGNFSYTVTLQNLLTDTVKEMVLEPSLTYSLTNESGGYEIVDTLIPTNADMYISYISVSSSIFSSTGVLGTNGWVKIYDLDSLTPEVPIATFSTTTKVYALNLSETNGRLRIETSAAAKENTNISFTVRVALQSSFLQKLGDDCLKLVNVNLVNKFGVRFEGEEDFTTLQTLSTAKLILLAGVRPSFALQANSDKVINSVYEDVKKTYVIKMPGGTTYPYYAVNPVFYVLVPSSLVVSDAQPNIEYGGIENYTISSIYQTTNASGSAKYTVIKIIVPGTFKGIGDIHELYFDLYLRASPTTTATTSNIYVYASTDNADYYRTSTSNTYKDDYDVNLNGDRVELMARSGYAQMTVSRPPSLFASSYTTYDGIASYPPKNSKVMPGTSATLNVEIVNGLTTATTDRAINLEILVRLPFVGNKSIETGNDLNSEFNVTLAAPVTLPSTMVGTNKGTVYYSSSETAVETDLTNGSDLWTTDALSIGLSNVKSILIVTGSAYYLAGGNTGNVTIPIEVNIPYGADEKAVSYYTYNVKNDFNSGSSSSAESAAAGIEIALETAILFNPKVVNQSGIISSNFPSNTYFTLTLINANDQTKRYSITSAANLLDNEVITAIEYGTYNVSLAAVDNFTTGRLYSKDNIGDSIDEGIDSIVTQITIDETTPVANLIALYNYIDPVVTEKYQTNTNIKLEDDTNETVIWNTFYEKTAVSITGYVPIGYKLGETGSVIPFSDSTNTLKVNVVESRTVVFVYGLDTNYNGIVDTDEGVITEKYRDIAGNEIGINDTSVTVGLNGSYVRTIPNRSPEWTIVGYRIDDGELITGNSISILNVTSGDVSDHTIYLVYKKATYNITINYRFNSTILYTTTINDVVYGTNYIYDAEAIYTEMNEASVHYKTKWDLKSNQNLSVTITGTGHVINVEYEKRLVDLNFYYVNNLDTDDILNTIIINGIQVGSNYIFTEVEEFYIYTNTGGKWEAVITTPVSFTVAETNEIKILYSKVMSIDKIVIKYTSENDNVIYNEERNYLQVGTTISYTVDQYYKNIETELEWTSTVATGLKTYTVQEDNNVITIPHIKRMAVDGITINYKYGDQIIPVKTETPMQVGTKYNYEIKNTYTHTDNTIWDFALEDVGNKIYTVVANGNTIIYNITPRMATTKVTINYYDYEEDTLLWSDVDNNYLQVGMVFNYTIYNSYNYDSGLWNLHQSGIDGTKTHIITDNSNTIDIYLVKVNSNLLIKYVDIDDEENIIRSYNVENVQVGSTYKFTPDLTWEYSGTWTVVDNSQREHEVTDGINTITIKYSKKMSTDRVVVKYIEKDNETNVLYTDDTNGLLQVGSELRISIPGTYVKDGNWNAVTGIKIEDYIVKDNNNTILFEFTKDMANTRTKIQYVEKDNETNILYENDTYGILQTGTSIDYDITNEITTIIDDKTLAWELDNEIEGTYSHEVNKDANTIKVVYAKKIGPEVKVIYKNKNNGNIINTISAGLRQVGDVYSYFLPTTYTDENSRQWNLDGYSENKDHIVNATNNEIIYYFDIVLKTEAHLSNLTLVDSNLNLSPVFNENIFDYTINVPNTKTTFTAAEINAILKDSTATIDMPSVVNLSTTNNNYFNIVVTAEDTSVSETYRIKIIRAKAANNLLNNIAIDKGTLNPGFDSAITNYTVTVDNDIDSIILGATAEDSTATISGIGSKNLAIGINRFTIVVTAENGLTKNYYIEVTRKANDEVTLNSLEIAGYELDPIFNSNTFEYLITVPNEKNTFFSNEVTAIPKDENASITMTSMINLSTNDENIFEIFVTAEDGITTQTYTIVIRRNKSDEALLKDLSITNHTLNSSFKSTTFEYTIHVNNDKTTLNSNEVMAILADQSANITMPTSIDLYTNTNNYFEIEVTSESGLVTNIYTINVIRGKSSNNYLYSLTTGYVLNPFFNKNILSYTMNVSSTTSSINLNAIAESKTASVTGTGIKNLNYGTNNFIVSVIAEDGQMRNYGLTIIRAIPLSDNNNLKLLEINGHVLNPIFSPDITSYELTVSNDVSSLNIVALAADDKSRVSIIGASDLKEGTNTITISVTAENNTVKHYKITVIKEKAQEVINPSIPSNDATLSFLEVLNGSYSLNPFFSSNIKSYAVTIPNDITYANIKALANENANIKITGNANLKVGNNIVTVTVTAEDGTEEIYEIIVVRQAMSVEQVKSSNANLKLLILPNLIPEFNRNITDYTVTIPREVTAVDIKAIAEDPKAKVELFYDGELIIGQNNLVEVVVTAEDGTVKYYAFNIYRSEIESSSYLKNLSVKGHHITPKFDETILGYSLTVGYNVTDLDVIATPKYDNLNIEIIGDKNLEVGDNYVQVIVTDENNFAKTYYIVVTRLEPSNNYYWIYILIIIIVISGTIIYVKKREKRRK